MHAGCSSTILNCVVPSFCWMKPRLKADIRLRFSLSLFSQAHLLSARDRASPEGLFDHVLRKFHQQEMSRVSALHLRRLAGRTRCANSASCRTEITRSSCNGAKSNVPRATGRQRLNTKAETQACWRLCSVLDPPWLLQKVLLSSNNIAATFSY